MKKEIETFLETICMDNYNPKQVEDVSEIMLKILESEAHREYFEIVNKYMLQKKELNMTLTSVAEISGSPILTVRRFENLKHYPNIITLIKLLNTVGLKLTVAPISEVLKQNT